MEVKDFPVGTMVRLREFEPGADGFVGRTGLEDIAGPDGVGMVIAGGGSFVHVLFGGITTYCLPDELERGHYEKVWVKE